MVKLSISFTLLHDAIPKHDRNLFRPIHTILYCLCCGYSKVIRSY